MSTLADFYETVEWHHKVAFIGRNPGFVTEQIELLVKSLALRYPHLQVHRTTESLIEAYLAQIDSRPEMILVFDESQPHSASLDELLMNPMMMALFPRVGMITSGNSHLLGPMSESPYCPDLQPFYEEWDYSVYLGQSDADPVEIRTKNQ